MVMRRGFNIEKKEKVLIIEDVITTGGSVKEVMNLVQSLGASIVGLGILVDRSNGTIKLHKNQYSIINMGAVSYDVKNIPENLAKIPIQRPGSRKS